MSTDVVQRIKDIPIAQVISAYYPLQSKGKDHVGVCPFHDDHKPSMSVSDSKGVFKCFACGAGGDAIKFVQDLKNYEFKETLIDIAEKFGIPVDSLKQPRKINPKFEIGYKVNNAALRLYKKAAQSGNYPEYEKFLKTRGLSQEMAQQFSLGYAPNSGALSNYLKTIPETDRDKASNIAKEIGIIRPDKKREGEHYDSFRDRVIFPIWDQYENVVGFGSRAVFDYQKGKYINSQESFLFNKKNILYGLNFAKQSIRNTSQVILVEGYMDCISLVKNSFAQTVAVMGVAIGQTSVKNLVGMAKDVILGLDTDNAGFTAAQRINELFMREGLLPRFISYAPYKDPDEFLANNGALELQKRIDEAPAFVDVLIKKLIPEKTLANLDKKLEVLQKIFQILHPLKNSLSATERVIDSAKKLGLKSTNDQIIDTYQRFLKDQKDPMSSAKIVEQTADLGTKEETTVTTEKSVILTRTDEILLSYLSRHPECFRRSKATKLLEFVVSHEVQKMVQVLENIYFEVDENQYPRVVLDMLRNDTSPENIKVIVRNGLSHFNATELDEEKVDKMVNDLVKKLKIEKLLEEKKTLTIEQKNCDSQEQVFTVLKKISEIQQQLNELKR